MLMLVVVLWWIDANCRFYEMKTRSVEILKTSEAVKVVGSLVRFVGSHAMHDVSYNSRD